MTQKAPEDRQSVTRGGDPQRFTPESIQRVRDFTARKTLEQAHAFVTGLSSLFGDADPDEPNRPLLEALESVGLGPHDVEQIATDALALMDLMADRDRKAEIFHAAVKEAGQSERAMYARLAMIARVLRGKLGNRSPDLEKLGVPPEPEPGGRPPRRTGKAIFSSVATK